MTRWYSEKKHEHYYNQAKKDGYRARSAYKLKQINKRFNIIKKGDKILDLGAAPGGWSQVAKRLVGETGLVLGVDILPVQKIDGVSFIKGDMTNDSTIEIIKEKLSNYIVDCVISDMSPDISGNYSLDQARSIYLCEKAFETTKLFLKQNGHFICKIFEGADFEQFKKSVKPYFSNIKIFNPKASRKSSSEIYLICKSFNKKK